MKFSMYHNTVPVYERMLANLVNCLKKAETFSESRNIDVNLFLQSRLVVDMLPLSKQIEITSDLSCRSLARLTGSEIPEINYEETTFAGLYECIDRTLDYIRQFKPEQIDGTEDLQISFKVREHNLEMTGEHYIRNFILPNFYFHVTTAYNILRHNGVELGKLDYLGKPG